MAQNKLKFAPTVNAFNTTLNGSISATDLTVTLNSVTGLQNKAGILVIDRQDSSGNNTPTKREYIYFTSVSGSAVILPSTGDGRGQSGSTAQSHADGAKVEAVMDVDQYNGLIDSYDAQHADAGTHDALTTNTFGGSSLASISSILFANALMVPSTASLSRTFVGTETIATSFAATSLATTSFPTGIQPEMLNLAAINLGVAQLLSIASVNSGVPVQVIALSKTVSIPAGGRSIEVRAFLPNFGTGSGNTGLISLWDGTVGSGTMIAASQKTFAATGTFDPMFISAIVTPAAGAKTYNVGMHNTAGGVNSVSVSANATTPAYLAVLGL